MEPSPLSGVELKLGRARTHLEALEDAYSTFCDRDPWTISMQYEDREYSVTSRDESGEERLEMRTDEYAVFRVHIQEQPPSAWSVIIGDCLQNARAALEHLAWQLASPEYGGSGPNNYISFPIYSKRRKYKNMVAGRYSNVQAMAEPAQEMIEGLQPYQRGTDA